MADRSSCNRVRGTLFYILREVKEDIAHHIDYNDGYLQARDRQKESIFQIES